MNKVLFILISVTCLLGCSTNNRDSHLKVSNSNNKDNELPPLVEGEVIFDNNVFGPTIDLTGICHPVDNFFEVRELEMLAFDSLLIVKNKNGENIFMAYSLPDFHFLKSFGRIGKGPNEFQFPALVKTNDPDAYCHIQEWQKSRLLTLNHSLEINALSVEIPVSSIDRQIYSVTDSNYFMVLFNEGKKCIIELNVLPDTLIENSYLNLAFSNDLNDWPSYIGDFGLNYEHKRIVYAYKYFNRIVFIDFENSKSRVVQFNEQNEEADLKTNPLGPENTTFYWGLSSNNKYVYLLYSGRTPIDVTEELRRGPGYIFVEQFDWNGNPIRKFKLDHWGYFCVSEDEKTIYLASITEEQPFYSYIIPELEIQP